MDFAHVIEVLLTIIGTLVWREQVSYRKLAERTHARVNEFATKYAGDQVERELLKGCVQDHEHRIRKMEGA
jgi:hypothetical protein